MKLKIMEIEQDIHRGFLLLPPVGKLIKKSWQKKYCLLFKTSKFGLGRLEIYETQDTKIGQPKIITLENVIKITLKDTKTFNILTKSSENEFMVLEEESLSDWVTAVQSVAFPDEVSKVTSIVEDNELYCSSGEGVFYVKLHSSPVSERCNLKSIDYILLLTDTALQLRTIEDNSLLFTWPYCYIRRYGYKHGKFTFEAGRKCDSGEGIFFLEHSNQQEIFRCLATKMKSMKKLLTGESMSSLMGNEELQFFEARNMKAGSRSPLPISSQMTMGSMQDSLNTMFNRSFSQISQSTSHLDSQPSSVNNKPLLRPKPKVRTSKPSILRPAPSAPNLNLSLSLAKSKESIMSDYEPIGTMNNEQVRTHDKEEADQTQSWSKLKKELEVITKPIDKTVAPAVITEPISTLDGTDYDKLNFFGSTSRLNNSGYKPVPFHHASSTPSFNQYDEVSPIEPARSADDSHLGYAKVRKDPLNNSLKEIKDKKEISHQYTNREPYAVISKAKHV